MVQAVKIAIDGPAGAGKSTVAKLVAKRLNIMYLDTGAMYRAIALKGLNTNLDFHNKQSVIKLLEDTNLQVVFEDNMQKMILDGEDVSEQIRTTEVSNAASCIAASPEVRKKLVQLQREIAKECSVVMDGRDIGTYVLPNADVKIFLTASLEERASRRYGEYRRKGIAKTLDDVIEEIRQRDRSDSTREFAPLKQADDAIYVDTTSKGIEQVVDTIIDIIDDKGLRSQGD